jgi:hypothetical protein
VQGAGAGHGLVEAKLAAEADHYAGVSGGEILQGLLHQGVEASLVDDGGIHGAFSLLCWLEDDASSRVGGHGDSGGIARDRFIHANDGVTMRHRACAPTKPKR